MDDRKILFKGEMQLLGWQENHNSGAKITLQLADASELEPFKHMTVRKGKQAGQRLAVVFVEIGDDEQPVDQVDANAMQKPKGGALSILSGRWCGMAQFHDWLQQRYPTQWLSIKETLMESGRSAVDSEIAAGVVRSVCGVTSRIELDHDADAAARFHRHIRIPFAGILEESREPAY